MYFITLFASYLVRHAGFRLDISLFKATNGRLRIAIFEILASVGNCIPAKSANVNELLAVSTSYTEILPF